MTHPTQLLPLQASGRASFRGDQAIVDALEPAFINTPPAQIEARAPLNSERNHNGEFVVVTLEEHPTPRVGGTGGEGSDLKNVNSKYGSAGDDVELGSKTGNKHLSNASKDDAADGETVCRVCHLGFSSGNCESIVLGCACKQDLALCHRNCAEEWFKIRGNTVCEICGETAKNVHIPDHVESTSARLEADGTSVHTHRVFVRSTAMSRLRYGLKRWLVRKTSLFLFFFSFCVFWLVFSLTDWN